MNRGIKITLFVVGALSLVLVFGQLVLGQLILGGRADLVKAHQHSGYTAVVLSALYIVGSLAAIAQVPAKRSA